MPALVEQYRLAQDVFALGCAATRPIVGYAGARFLGRAGLRLVTASDPPGRRGCAAAGAPATASCARHGRGGRRLRGAPRAAGAGDLGRGGGREADQPHGGRGRGGDPAAVSQLIGAGSFPAWSPERGDLVVLAVAHIDADLDNAIERLFETLRIKSISTDPGLCRRDPRLRRMARRRPRLDRLRRGRARHAGHPMVVGHAAGRRALGPVLRPLRRAAGRPAGAVGHDPFEPSIETRPDGTKEIRARGASDDKGQLMTFVEACRAWKAVTGKLPIPVTVLLEGEEESGGVNLPPFLDANMPTSCAPTSALICDTNMWDKDTPAITTMLRGLCGEEIIIHAADRDLHSGFYGSAAANPNHVLARILADLHDETGASPCPASTTACPNCPRRCARVGEARLRRGAFLGEIGLSVPAGERAARCWSRSGRARPARSTAWAAAIRARASRR
jgi:hypothetical protein